MASASAPEFPSPGLYSAQDRLHGHGVRRGNPVFLERVPTAWRSAEDRPHDGEIRRALLLAGKGKRG